MWWESRERGLEGREPGTNEPIAWVVPNPDDPFTWIVRYVHHNKEHFGSMVDARLGAEKKLGGQVTWWIFRLGFTDPMKRLERGSTR